MTYTSRMPVFFYVNHYNIHYDIFYYIMARKDILLYF